MECRDKSVDEFMSSLVPRGPKGGLPEGLATLHMIQDYQGLAPEAADYTLLIKGVAGRKIGEKELKEYLSGLAQVLGMKTTIEAEAWKAPRGWMAAIALEQSSPLVNVWQGQEVVFKVNIDSREAFCIRGAVALTKDFFQAKDLALIAL